VRGWGGIVETSIGPLGIAGCARGLSRVILPPPSERRDRERLVREALGSDAPAALDGLGRDWAERLVAHLDGDDVDYDDLPIDHEGITPFARRVYETARRIPRGVTWTYGALGAAIGSRSARAIGVALGRNPTPIVVPCHRIVAKDGCGGFSAFGGTATKAQLLAIEGGTLGDPEHVAARRHLARVDPNLRPLVRAIPCTLPVRPNGALLRTIVRAITGQQLSTKAAATIFARLETALGFDLHPPAKDRDPAWRAPVVRWPDDADARIASASIEALRAVGLSAAKVASLHDLARRVERGALDLARLPRMSDDRVISALLEVRGIGRWTAEMLLIFDLGRPDVLPITDLGIRKGLERIDRLRALPEPTEVLARAEAWRPFRSIGSWYLWRALEGSAPG
jgi:O-6-methylguanine DNA methyltransferase